MSLTITIPAELEAQVQAAAARVGCNIEEYVIGAVKSAVTRLSLDEILAPVRAQFAASSMTEDDLTSLVKEERRAMWREKHGENPNDNTAAEGSF